MLSALELGLFTRQSGDLPAWISGGEPAQSLHLWSLADGKSVTLRSRAGSILVYVRERSSLFVGEIYGFEPDAGSNFPGMSVRDLIVFREEHIFGASP
jgi:hypothetical protein